MKATNENNVVLSCQADNEQKTLLPYVFDLTNFSNTMREKKAKKI